MGRYSLSEKVIFTNYKGQVSEVLSQRNIPKYNILDKYVLKSDDMPDEIITRKDYYDEGAENKAYAIIEANKEKMVDFNFDLSKIKEIIIPIC